jgi:hypothetical protein
MGVFDGSGRFTTAQDGSRLFFPRYSGGSGYVIASEQDYERLRRQVKVYEIVCLIVVVAALLIFVFDAFKNPRAALPVSLFGFSSVHYSRPGCSAGCLA